MHFPCTYCVFCLQVQRVDYFLFWPVCNFLCNRCAGSHVLPDQLVASVPTHAVWLHDSIYPASSGWVCWHNERTGAHPACETGVQLTKLASSPLLLGCSLTHMLLVLHCGLHLLWCSSVCHRTRRLLLAPTGRLVHMAPLPPQDACLVFVCKIFA